MEVKIMQSKIIFLTVIISLTVTFLISCDNNQNRTIDHIPTQGSIDTLKTILNDLERQLSLAIIAATPPRRPPNPTSVVELQKASEQAAKELKFLESLTCTNTLEELKAKINDFNNSSTLNNTQQLMGILNQFINELRTQTKTKIWKELVPSNNSRKLSDVFAKLKSQVNNL
jgi:hypothetical protein